MEFDSEEEAYDFYNAYGGRIGVPACNVYELMGRQSGGKESVRYLKVDLKNYLRTRRQNELLYGEAAWLVDYFETRGCEDPSFFYSLQLDTEQMITNIFCFNTTYKVVHGNRPFAIFLGMNQHQETAVFGVALMYDETVDSFVCLFEMFLKAMGEKAPKTIITDQDAAKVKALKQVMPVTKYHLCVWHLMNNAQNNLMFLFKHVEGIKKVISKLMFQIEKEDDFITEWDLMIAEYGVAAEYGLLERQPELKTKYHILRQAGKVYTKAIFQLFQEDFLAALASQAVISCSDLDNNGHRVYKVAGEDRVQHIELSYSCCKFQREGYLCRHSLKILKDCMFVNELPSRYIIKGWTRNARDGRLEEIVSTDVNLDPQLEIR
ncbi:protein FAR1-RELATED SEQUENCE 3-like [Cornus florida]|uniref:protein FAR1-RELATED SEQUENCE 3-like n=1 Tax=Cornus florida TaxID=4283 RepID=UPI00289DD8DF|nr:protein FAR1-RELATED SEQUENCE 3-like [Cornus florida]